MWIACQVFLPLTDVLYRPGAFELLMCDILPSCGGNLVFARQHCLVGLWMLDVCQLSSYQLPDVLLVGLCLAVVDGVQPGSYYHLGCPQLPVTFMLDY